jgi:hypothetical protein
MGQHDLHVRILAREIDRGVALFGEELQVEGEVVFAKQTEVPAPRRIE